MTARPRPQHHFERVLLAALQRGRGEQRFAVADQARTPLARALDVDLDSPTAAEALEAGLRLAAAFDGAMASPSVAALIRDLLRENPRAVSLLVARRPATSAIDALRSHVRREDRPLPMLPISTETPPPGSRPLRAWLNTGNTQPRGQRPWMAKA